MGFFDKLRKKSQPLELEAVFSLLRDNPELSAQIGALCSMDFLDRLTPIQEISSSHAFSMDAAAFAGNGSGGYYVLLGDHSIGWIDYAENACGRVAETLQGLLELELNCAFSWQNYLLAKYVNDTALLEQEIAATERTGREDFEDAYGDSMTPYDELQSRLADALHLRTFTDIAGDVLLPLYQAASRPPRFTGQSTLDGTPMNGLIQ